MERLELLSLVSKITTELQNHLGVNDKTLAEFVIAQHDQSASFATFKARMESMEVDFPSSLLESIHRLIMTMHPKCKNQEMEFDPEMKSTSVGDLERKAQIYKGLAVPDNISISGRNHDCASAVQIPPSNNLDETFTLLEDLASSGGHINGLPRGSKRHRSPDRDENGSSRSHMDKSNSQLPLGRIDVSKQRRTECNNHVIQQSEAHLDHHDPDEHRQQYLGDRPNILIQNKEHTSPKIDAAPLLFKIYDGLVTGVKDFGVFVNLHRIKGKVDGLVHVSAMQEGARVNHPLDLVSRGQHIKVKVVSIQGGRIGLSMKDVDQSSGRDLAPQARLASGANLQCLDAPTFERGDTMRGSQNKESHTEGESFGNPNRPRKRMTSPERFEIKQLIASGVFRASDYPDIDDELKTTTVNESNFEEEIDIDIEVREEEPPFLAGQTKQSLELSPIRVVKAPDGSMNRAAMAGTSLAKERRDLRQQEAQDKAAEQASQVDLNAQWQDPMMVSDQRKFASDIRNPQSQRVSEALPEWKRIVQSKDQSFGKRTSMSIKQQRETLPVYKFRDQLLKAVRENQLMIVVGDTGSGKTTQLTQYLAEGGFADHGIIGCTQPRRVAAMSVAKRVAEEVGCKVGQEVGYTIRFEDCTSSDTKIKYMTDGMLEREVLLDPNLRRYTVIMLDEAHERTIATDVLFGLLKKTLRRRPDLKVIVTSATLDADKFSEYFNQCPIFTIPGRTYPVEIMYSREPESDYLDAALVTVMQIHLTEPIGDILLFLTGQEEIDTSCEILFDRMKALGPNVPELIILPVYSALPSEMQSKIFEPAPPNSRKVVIATNIAETSITIDQIYYVIDPGFVKQNAYDPKLGMDSLVVTPISQAQAKQRAGRAGRTGPGKCFRLYTETAFLSEMLPTSIPEIQRQNLSHTILMLKAMGINDLLHFDFMDPPPTNTMLTALEELYALSALDDEGLLTRLGRKMADFPMEPALAKVLIYSVDIGCSDEVLSIVAMLSVQTVFYRPKEKQQQADQKKAKFHDPHGDHLTLLNVYNGWKQANFSNPWCFENFIQARSMKRAQDVRQQLVTIMERYKHRVVSCGRNTMKVRQALCSGFFRNAARKDPQEGYKTLIEGTPVYMHPSSAMFGKPAEHVIFHTLVLTTKEYMHCTTGIEPRWLVDAAPTFFKVAPSDQLSKRKKAERIQPLYNRFAGEDDWRLSAQKRQGRGGGGGTWG